MRFPRRPSGLDQAGGDRIIVQGRAHFLKQLVALELQRLQFLSRCQSRMARSLFTRSWLSASTYQLLVRADLGLDAL